jgi:hypothetical protein
MARLRLNTKEADIPEPEYKERMTVPKVRMKSGYIAQHDPEMYPLLKDNRYEDEKFSRVDRFWVNHYYLIGTEWLCEKIFYPSSYGFDMIEKENIKGLKDLCKRLIKEGIGLWGERPTPNIEKPVERIQLECKPKVKRVRLECKE